MNIPKEHSCPYCHASATLGAVYYDQNCAGCVKRMSAQQPVSMEPYCYEVVKAMCDTEFSHTKVKDAILNEPLYTATQLAAARQQGAEDQTDKTLEAVRVASERIAKLEKSNAVLLKCLEELSAYIAYNGDDWVRHKALAAIAEVKP